MTEATIELLYHSFARSRKALGRSARTIEQYDISIKHFTRFMQHEFDSTAIALVNRRVIEDFLIEHMAENRTTTTANKTFRSLRAFFNWLYEEDMLEINPFRRVKAPKPTPAPKSGYTRAEVDAQLEPIRMAMQGHGRERFLAFRDYALFMVLYDTGLRASEICAMTVEGIDPDTGLFEVPGKGRQVYRRHLGSAALAAVTKYLTARSRRVRTSSDKLWVNFSGFPLTRSGLFRMCQVRATDAGIKNGGVHRWRYTHAETLQDLGWPEEVIMAEMGHSMLSVSRHYRQTAIRRRALKQHELQSPADLLGGGFAST